MTNADTGRPGSHGEHELQERLGNAKRAKAFYDNQVLDHLTPLMREFMARMRMAFIATSDSHGDCDSSFRAGPPGFVRVLDEKTVCWPEYKGNGVMASMGNMSENPHVGLLFVDFLDDGVGLHVNGAATIVEDPDMRAEHPRLPTDTVPGRRATRWVVTEVHEAYIHCARFVPRLGRQPSAEVPHRKRRTTFVDRDPRVEPAQQVQEAPGGGHRLWRWAHRRRR
jgi:predicted pyridoxine 5'-phosphate oxidase superfamily flavin-nucleotide-binding protein